MPSCSAFYWEENLCYTTSASKLGGPDLNPLKVFVDSSYNDSELLFGLHFRVTLYTYCYSGIVIMLTYYKVLTYTQVLVRLSCLIYD